MYSLKSLHDSIQRGRPLIRSEGPAPFAGPHPTRIYWKVVRRSTKEEYLGRWSTAAVRRFLKLTTQLTRADNASFVEFDRAHTAWFTWWSRDNRRFQQKEPHSVWHLYHPFQNTQYPQERSGLLWLPAPFWLKRIHTVKGVFSIYSPIAVLNQAAQVNPFKRYVEAQRWS